MTQHTKEEFRTLFTQRYKNEIMSDFLSGSTIEEVKDSMLYVRNIEMDKPLRMMPYSYYESFIAEIYAEYLAETTDIKNQTTKEQEQHQVIIDKTRKAMTRVVVVGAVIVAALGCALWFMRDEA